MQLRHRRVAVIMVMAFVLPLGCSLTSRLPISTPDPGAYGATIAALQTKAVATAAAEGLGSVLTAAPPALLPAQTVLASRFALVATDASCWRGPSPDYEVIAKIPHGTEVPLLGRGVISGWFVVRSPAYGDPCWLQASVLQFPAGYDIGTLPVYNPPATATITPLPTSATPGTPGPTQTP